MAFCKFCGKEISDNSVCFCQEVNNATPQPPILNNPNLASSGNSGSTVAGMDIKTLAILGGGALVALIFVIMIFSAVFGAGYKKPIKNLVKGMEKTDSKTFASAFPDKTAKTYRKVIDDDALEEMIEELEDDYGKNIKFSVKFEGKEKLENRDIREYKDEYKAMHDKSIDIKKAYEVEVTLKIKGKEDKDEDTIFVVVGKIKGEGWKVLDSGGINSAF